MKKEKHEKTTVTVRLTDEEDQVLSRLCILKKTSKTGWASLSELAKKTGLDVPTIMDEVANRKGEDKRAVEAFLSAVETISRLNKDPEFYNLAINAVSE